MAEGGMSKMSRENIARRVRALAAMTRENGCTEEEAITAAEMLGRMLREHNMTLDEAALREQPFSRHTEAVEDIVGERLWKPADGIAYLTGCRYWTSRPGVAPVTITFFGFDHEVEVAKYLLDICARAMRDGRRVLDRSNQLLNPAKRRQRLFAYLDGMADTLRQRIRDLRPPEPAGTGLIVLRDALIVQALALEKIKLDQGRGRPSRDLDSTYKIGVAAAERVRLDRGVGHSGGEERLLK